jgi:8-oxo-dGTP pyrophosphatase MutT (NUDIX family)
MISERSFPKSFNAYRPHTHYVYGVICVTRDKKYLLVKGRQSNKWSFPKGHRNRGELAIDCAIRELYEETGISLCKPLEYPKSAIFSRNKDGSGPEYFYFDVSKELDTHINDVREISDIGWFSLDDMACMNGNIDITRFVKTMRYTEGIQETSQSQNVEPQYFHN